MREETERTASVPLERPVKTSPTTGSTGAPHPTTLHGPVESPRTLANAPTTPPLLDAEAREREYRTGDREEGDGTGAHRGTDAPPRHHARSTDTSQHVISGNKSTRTLIISGTDSPRVLTLVRPDVRATKPARAREPPIRRKRTQWREQHGRGSEWVRFLEYVGRERRRGTDRIGRVGHPVRRRRPRAREAEGQYSGYSVQDGPHDVLHGAGGGARRAHVQGPAAGGRGDQRRGRPPRQAKDRDPQG